MNRRLLWYSLAFVIGISASLGFLFKTPITGSEEKLGGVESDQIIVSEEVEMLISTFINLLVNGNVIEASRYTTGDLQNLLESNKSQNVSGVLLDHQITPTFSNDQLVQAKVTANVKTQIGIDRQHYLYELVKQDDQWKIYRIGELPLIKRQGEIIREKVPAVVEMYLKVIANGNWSKSMDYLAGEALLEVQKTFTFLPKNYSTKLELKDQKIIAENPDSLWVLSVYDLTSPDQKVVTRETLFQLEKADMEWKITQISNVTGGGNEDSH